VTYHVVEEGTDLYSVALDDGTVVGVGYKDIFNPASSDVTLPYGLVFSGLKAYTNSESTFTYNGGDYQIAEDGTVLLAGAEVGYISRYFVQAFMPDVFLTRAFKDELYDALNSGNTDFFFTDADGVEHEYKLYYDPQTTKYTIKQGTESRVYDTYSAPSSEHWLGTDGNGMDMLTRLMYGGRVSLLIGFIVELIATALGIILGGVAGYFGGWVDNLIMRIVDIFYCIPSLPIIIILGAAMDAMSVEPKVRMIYLMLILGFLGWPGLARMVRGQILSLREQEFMTATEACGVRVSRRIFKHLIPNVIPQLIVSCTMGLGSTIITEATLSFLGLGVRFPFASWGNIISDVNNTFVLTNYLFIWIPAGVLLLVTVLAFNIVGDGLRDAFDPKMKR
jgi:peptide/nickel transport system permease protein